MAEIGNNHGGNTDRCIKLVKRQLNAALMLSNYKHLNLIFIIQKTKKKEFQIK